MSYRYLSDAPKEGKCFILENGVIKWVDKDKYPGTATVSSQYYCKIEYTWTNRVDYFDVLFETDDEYLVMDKDFNIFIVDAHKMNIIWKDYSVQNLDFIDGL